MKEIEKFPSSFVSSQFEEYISASEIKTISESLAHTLNQKYKGEELVIVGVLKGSIVFISELIRHLTGIKVYVDFVKISSVGRTKESNGTIILHKDIKTNILNKNVLIVEEIIDTGRAIYFLKDRLKQSMPRSIEVLTLMDKPYKRAVPLKIDYIGKKIEDKFIIGYGLDVDEYGRNLNDIYFLKYPN